MAEHRGPAVATLTIRVPMRLQRQGGRKLTVTPEGAAAPGPKPRHNKTLVTAIIRAHRWRRALIGAPRLPAVLAGAVALAVAANAYELLCTAGFPLVCIPVLTLRKLSPPAYYLYLALYNAVYILPFFAIVVAFAAAPGAPMLIQIIPHP